jgi:hypothetical protein
MNIVGALYFPSQTVDYSGGTASTSTCTQLIANDISFSGGSTFKNSCIGTGVSGIGSSATRVIE